MSSLSIIVPVFNEIRYLDKFGERLFNSFRNENIEYIFVNDGSTDGSEKWLENLSKKNKNKIKFVNLNQNTGKGNAIHKGIEIATSDYILFQDADLELDPLDSYEMYKIIKKNKNIECLFGSRYLSGKLKKNNNYINENFGKFNSFLFNLLFNQSLSDLHCGTKIISKNLLKKLNLSIKDFGFEIDIASQISKTKYDIYEYGISYFARTIAEGKKITWIDGIKSYFYLFKTRFIQNDLSIIFSLIFSTSYMIYLSSYFKIGLINVLIILFFGLIGMFIGLHNKILNSSIIMLFSYLGTLFGKENSKIFTVLVGLLIGLYFTKKIKTFYLNKKKNRLIDFLI